MSFDKFDDQTAAEAAEPAVPATPDNALLFSQLDLHAGLARAIAEAGYTQATEVQMLAIPPGIAGRDLMVSSRTGSGKTASFILPALQKILAARGDDNKRRAPGVVSGPRILVLTPTRELALQVAKAASTYGRYVQGLRVTTVVGGVPYPAQIKALRGPLDILIATPGRLLDHLQTGKAVLENVEMLVLDEADRMLDMGFIDDINTIAEQIPAQRQTVMYSATFAGHVGRLAQNLLRDPQRIDVASHTDTHENIEQRLHWADNNHHKNALLDHILTTREMEQAVVFTSTQRDADWLADRLADLGHACASLHGGMPQGRRNRVLQGLRNRQLRILVATDVAARGIDVPTISHVINYGLPMKPEDYVHRIGRTGRAGRQGLAVTLAERMDSGMIRRIQHFTTQDIPVARIAGLEPQNPEPRLGGPTRGNAPGGKSFGGGKSFDRGGFRGNDRGGSSFNSNRGSQGGFAPRAEGEGGGYKGGNRFNNDNSGSSFRPAPAAGAATGGAFEQRPRQEAWSERRPQGAAGAGAGDNRHGAARRTAGKPGFKPRTGGFGR
jgi:superfamily II DNA/RNA helicase